MGIGTAMLIANIAIFGSGFGIVIMGTVYAHRLRKTSGRDSHDID